MTVRLRHRAPYMDTVRQAGLAAPAVEAWTESIITSASSPAVQTAVYRAGELVVSSAGGYQEPNGQIRRDSLFSMLSTTKLYTTMVVLMLHDRGYFALDDTVAAHWPGFGCKGKERITIRHMLTHRAGIRLGPPGTSWGWWHDREAIGRWMEGMELEWEPGTAVGYHNRIFGFVLDNLVWRITGRGIDAWALDDIFAPLGVKDFHFGISRDLYDHRFVKAVPATAGAAAARAQVDPQVRQDEEFRPKIGDESNLFNSYELMRLPLAWGTTVSSAEQGAEVANIYAMGGVHRGLRLIEKSTLRQALEDTCGEGEVDKTLGGAAHWGLGIQLNIFPGLKGAEAAAGHGGGSTVHVWFDPVHQISAAAILSGAAQNGAAPGVWRRAFAEAVYSDLPMWR